MQFVGVDWASQTHAICVVDETGKVCRSFEVSHTEEGLSELLRQLRQLRDPSIAIERPDGILVDALLDAGHRVVPIHPNILKASRSRHSHAGKSDPGDAYILADLLRTDGHRFRVLTPHAAEVKALRIVVRSRKDLVKSRVAIANQLRSLLQATFPGGTKLFGALDCRISLAFLREYPTQSAADELDEKRLAAFLRSHSYPGRRSAGELLKRLRSAPHAIQTDALSGASTAAILALVAVLEQMVVQITALENEIKARLAQIDEALIVKSFPGGGMVNAAMIVTKLGQDRARFQTAEVMNSLAGTNPVTYASGKQRGVGFRRHCDREFREAMTCLANSSRKKSPWAADVYQRARERGCDHPHAIRILARSWGRILWRCWRDGVAYDPTIHRQAASFAAMA